jgi:acetyl/propionyl-CoA carboxylase alpha subunit
MSTALGLCHIEGVETNVAMHSAVIAEPDFMRGGVDTSWFAGRLTRSQNKVP